jgi:hypothetical protein
MILFMAVSSMVRKALGTVYFLPWKAVTAEGFAQAAKSKLSPGAPPRWLERDEPSAFNIARGLQADESLATVV